MKVFFLTILLFCASFLVLGQAKITDGCFLCKEKTHLANSPYGISFKKEWPLLLASTTLAAAGYFIKANDKLTPYTQLQLDALNRNDVNAFDLGATYNYSASAEKTSDILLYSGLVIMPTLFFSTKHTRKDFGQIAMLTYEVFAINYGLTTIVKSAANRNRPYVYNPDLSYEQRTDADSRFSFFSGHTSTTASLSFLFARVMTDYHPNMAKGYKIGVWSFAALLPATTGYFRIQAGKHYRTDVLAGYAIGALTGILIPQLHKNKKQNLSIYPSRVFNTNSIGLSLQL